MIDNPMIMPEWTYKKDNQWDEDNPNWEPEYKEDTDPSIDIYEEHQIERFNLNRGEDSEEGV